MPALAPLSAPGASVNEEVVGPAQFVCPNISLVQLEVVVLPAITMAIGVRISIPGPTCESGFTNSYTVSMVGPTVTVAALGADTVPFSSLHVMVKVVVCVRGPTDIEPLVAVLALQPSFAEQVVALVEVHEIVDMPPMSIVEGVAVTVTLGGAVTVIEKLL
jgi:hypothetical protein